MKETKFTFQRYEKKYLLSREKLQALWQELAPLVEPDAFFQSTVCSVYYDWEDFRLIRHSLDKPVYKEKLRLRSYNVPGPEDPVFVELKKKYTVVMVTHNMQQAVRVSDYCAFFLLGDLVEFSETEQMFSVPKDRRTEDYITGRFG